MPIGLALSIAHRFDSYRSAGIELGTTVISVITATTFIVQIVGPILLKFAIGQAGEIGMASSGEESHVPGTTGPFDWPCARG